jgi:prepilin-type processing-associated H-X9-DG protein
MFCSEHKGHLPRSYFVAELSSDARLVKLTAWLQKVSGASGHIDLDDDKGALWPYIKGRETRRKVLMCPGDEGEMLAGHPTIAAYPRNVSYSFNQFIYRDVGGVPALGLQMARVKESAQRILIYEELAPNDSWNIIGFSSDDVPSGRHGTNMKDAYRMVPNSTQYKTMGRGNFCFFDGHVESLSPSQILPPTQGGTLGSEKYHFPLVKGDRTTW